MSEPLKGVVVSHGELASAFVDAVRRITGEDDALVAVTNVGCGREELRKRLASALTGSGTVVFVDMPAGSCLQATVAEVHGRADVRVVAGVNLPMLLDFVYNRTESVDRAAARAVDHGHQAIQTFPR
jgi:mannose/fructose-specific phosphotransferase system component IIA